MLGFTHWQGFTLIMLGSQTLAGFYLDNAWFTLWQGFTLIMLGSQLVAGFYLDSATGSII